MVNFHLKPLNTDKVMNFTFFKVSRLTTKEQLNLQKRRLSLQYHPDKEGGSEELMTSINQEFDLALKLIEIRERRYDQLCNIEEKAMAGLSLIKPEIEPKIKTATKQALNVIVGKIVPERFKPTLLKGLNQLSPIIDKADILEVAKSAFGLAKQIVKPKLPD